MKTSTRRWLGAALLTASIAVGVVLQLSGRGLLGFDNQSAPTMDTLLISFHWSVLPVGALTVAALLCLFLPLRSDRLGRETTT